MPEGLLFRLRIDTPHDEEIAGMVSLGVTVLTEGSHLAPLTFPVKGNTEPPNVSQESRKHTVTYTVSLPGVTWTLDPHTSHPGSNPHDPVHCLVTVY